MRALISTGVLTGPAAEAWRAARRSYGAGAPVTSLGVDFADVKIAYGGKADVLARVAANPKGHADEKTARFRSPGEATWRVVLSHSPAEPGLDRGHGLPDGTVSVGGWSDLRPVLVLKNAGCDEVACLTRQGRGGGFVTDVIGLLGASDRDKQALLGLTDPNSSHARSIAESDGVWCTDRDAPSPSDLPAMFSAG